MLAEREWRAAEQTRQLESCQTLIMLSANVAGPIKSFPLLLKGFSEAQRLLESRLDQEGIPWTDRGKHCHSGGPTAFYALEAPAGAAKRIACDIEQIPDLGRLLDLDVLTRGGVKWDRRPGGVSAQTVPFVRPSRSECGRSRRHSVEALQWETVRRLREYFRSRYAAPGGESRVESHAL